MHFYNADHITHRRFNGRVAPTLLNRLFKAPCSSFVSSPRYRLNFPPWAFCRDLHALRVHGNAWVTSNKHTDWDFLALSNQPINMHISGYHNWILQSSRARQTRTSFIVSNRNQNCLTFRAKKIKFDCQHLYF